MYFWAVFALLGLFGQALSKVAYCPSSVKCPTGPSKYVIQLPNPDDCATFCKCLDGKAYLQHCPGDLLYNAKLQVCDYPQNVDCAAPPELSATPTKCPAGIIAKCPTKDPKNPVYFPYPGNEHKFCVCSNGVAWEQTCPLDLIFNTQKNVCVHPGKVCGASVSAQCPKVDPTYPVYMPDAENCHKFCECSSGVAYELDCPPGLVFDPEKDVCVNPQDYPCQTSGLQKLQQPLVNMFRSRAAVPIGLQEGQRCPNVVSDRCPSQDGQIPVYFPYPGECHLFCECSNGVAYQQRCPGNLVFNPHKVVCDSPVTTPCDASNHLL